MFSHWFLPADLPRSLCVPFHENPSLVVLSYLIAAFSAYTAFQLMGRVRAATTPTSRRLWLATAGVSLGLGIWAMHFIAMLAVEIADPIGYGPRFTALSAGFAVLASWIALGLTASNSHKRTYLVLAGLVLGAGIGLMHYIGMAALHLSAHIYYDPWRFAASLVVAVALSTAALFTIRDLPRLTKLDPFRTRLIASVVMGFAIVLMHYTGMFATFFYPEFDLPQAGLFFNASVMAGAIGAITLVILGMALFAALFDYKGKQARDLTAALINNLPGFFMLIDQAGHLRRWNENLAKHSGFPEESLDGIAPLAFVDRSDRERVAERVRGAFEDRFMGIECSMFGKGGGSRPVRWTGQTITNDGRRYLLAIGLDMTEVRAAGTRLQESEERLQTIFDAVTDGIIVYDIGSAAYIDVNPSFCQMFGYTREEVLALDFGGLSTNVFPYTQADITPLITRLGPNEPLYVEWHCKAKDGHRFWIELGLRHTTFGTHPIVLATAQDITERKRASEQISQLARTDFLTGLANRVVFVEALEHAIGLARRGAKRFAVLYLDLDRFKDVNDTLGHPVGDLLLRAVAERLQGTVRAVDAVSRFGGDEFAIILVDTQQQADSPVVADDPDDPLEESAVAAAVAQKILQAIGEPFVIQGNEIRTSATIGIAVYGADAPDAESMLSHADVALYRAKAEGRGIYRFFTDAMDAEVRARITLDAELRVAIDANQFFLVYQPTVDIDTGRIVGLEALVRWRHPTRGIVEPAAFIPAAEKSGLIVALGRWVMREACVQTKRWLDAGIAPPSVAVNVSAVQFKMPLKLQRDIAAALADSGLPARRLELELTETALMQASHERSDVLAQLRGTGHRITIDDFGTGYSSLDYLRRYPVDRIKIPQSFVADIGLAKGGEAIVKATLGLARELGMEVVVEGVETAKQLELLKSWGCRIAQGYYFARPLSVRDATVLLRTGRIAPVRTGERELVLV